ncbi:MAG: trigger factor [Chloroflexi bacterium]|nr:trigger factor [Chloroflexota bacterium]
MNIQTERLENHTARFTIELDVNRLEQAKQEAARKLAKWVNIPGFRKGKAPYRILVNYIGEGAVLEEAVEILGNDLYKEALDKSGVEPYGPGELEKFDLEPTPTFIFTVPLQPEVQLNDYRSVRLEFTPPTVEDDDVNRSMKMLQEQHALVEESHKPVAPGNRVTVDIHAEVLPETPVEAGAETDEHDEHEEHDDHDDHAPHTPGAEPLLHEHDAVLILDEEHDEPAPGFRDALMGANVGERREFELIYPDDKDEYEDLAGKRAKFYVTIKKIETITLPALNDDFAARITAEEEKPLTLLELRMRMRENLQKAAEQRAKSLYAGQALDRIVEQATVSFPDALVNDQIEDYLERLDRDLRQRGLTLDDYMRITGKTREDLYNDYRETAVMNLKRSLVLREVLRAEGLTVAEEAIDEEIERILSQFGAQAEGLRSMFQNESMRNNVRNDLLEQHVLDRIVAIAKGEAPEPTAPEQPEADETVAESTQGEG